MIFRTGNSYYHQKCKYVVKEKKMLMFISDNIEFSFDSDRKDSSEESSGDESFHEESSDEEHSDKKMC